MTATIAPVADLSSVLTRAEKRYAKSRDEEPRDPEYVAELVSVVAPLLKAAEDAGAELAAAAPASAVVEDAGELERTRLELRRQNASVNVLRGKVAERGRELEQLRGEFAEVKAVAEKVAPLEADNVQIANALAEVEARAERLDTELEQARAAVQEKAVLVHQQRTQIEADSNHQHQYPWPDPAHHPLPCACGQVWPLTAPRPERPAPPETEPDPWNTIRTELKDWPRA